VPNLLKAAICLIVLQIEVGVVFLRALQIRLPDFGLRGVRLDTKDVIETTASGVPCHR
jgi:hypothetical protein